MRIRWAYAIGLGMMMAAAAAGSLPRPVDLPSGPAGATDGQLGGANLPLMGDDPVAATAPVLAAGPATVLPDETMVLAGANLQGATLTVWAEGGAAAVVPLRSAADRLQAVVPYDWPESTLLVWPQRQGEDGLPWRVNGAELWWSWPTELSVEQAAGAQEVILLGRNLRMAAGVPAVWLAGPGGGQWLTLTAANRYQLRALLPAGLAAGDYQLWAHNGTGGAYGWSAAVGLAVVARPGEASLPTFSVETYGAVADDGLDDYAAVAAAVQAAVSAGGGVVALGPGAYHLSQGVTVPAGAAAGVHLAGHGMGAYADGGTHDLAQHTLGGTYSALYALDDGGHPQHLLQVECPYSSVRDLTLVNVHDGTVKTGFVHHLPVFQTVVRSLAAQVRYERVRFILQDGRPDVAQASRPELFIYDSALFIEAGGSAGVVVQDCEFLVAGGGVQVGYPQYAHAEAGLPDPSTNGVRIADSVFRGYSVGLYKYEQTYNLHYDHCEGINLLNAKQVLIEGCAFSGADRWGCRMLNRSIQMRNTSTRHVYIAGNTCSEIGFVPPAGTGEIINMGEQVLFHYRYPSGGYFDVLAAGDDWVTVDRDDPRNAGSLDNMGRYADRTASRVPAEVGLNDHWLLYIAAGTGAGQYRVVAGQQDQGNGLVQLSLAQPWRVTPDTGSRVLLFVAYRQNVVRDNTIDAGTVCADSKTGGTQFWLNAVDNVVAGNTYRNLSYGAVFNSSFRNPCLWNLVRDNVAESMSGYVGAGSLGPSGGTDSYYVTDLVIDPAADAASDCVGWLGVGNAWRGNRVTTSPTGSYVHAHVGDNFSRTGLTPQANAGLMMPVVENNLFSAISESGITYNAATAWLLLRNNVIATSVPWARRYYDQSAGLTQGMLMIEETRCGVPGTVYLPGDVNRDCYVDWADAAALQADWLAGPTPVGGDLPGDVNDDGGIDLADVGLLAESWLACSDPAGCD